MPPIQITVFTGFLGAGKTSIILSLLPQLPKDYKVCLLKNEFGDVEVDSQLARQSSLTAVSEILNGCMCCVLVGQMKTALLEIRDKYHPDRVIIETSGSAFPATLAFQIRDLEKETSGDFKLDSIVTVIDAENFVGYEDSSTTARMQAAYTDLILINKWENVSERQLDDVIDHLHTLNDLTPKLRCHGRNGVSPDVIFGIDSKLFLQGQPHEDSAAHEPHDTEVETLTGPAPVVQPLSAALLESALATLPKESIYRVKGFIHYKEVDGPSAPISSFILNWAFGRFDLTPLQGQSSSGGPDEGLMFTVMGAPGETKKLARRFASLIGAQVS
ncbi:cobW-domain-containing protein [Sistotremastrum suecicum HHB10207 ss-3]|uniref:CobW-domain-containing protein n=1 Tax=Sistotremastrum suecicum HHB10207 ss-3 TaxID=1314776 RepID=A0A166G3J7_9AGAM|nr:cobW-domain-containing protein [Sistotremastrum suecicum HHB10207 ss-3]